MGVKNRRTLPILSTMLAPAPFNLSAIVGRDRAQTPFVPSLSKDESANPSFLRRQESTGACGNRAWSLATSCRPP